MGLPQQAAVHLLGSFLVLWGAGHPNGWPPLKMITCIGAQTQVCSVDGSLLHTVFLHLVCWVHRQWREEWVHSWVRKSDRSREGVGWRVGVEWEPWCRSETLTLSSERVPPTCASDRVTSCDNYLSVHGTSLPCLVTCHLILLWCLLFQGIFSEWLCIHLWHLN